MAINLPNKGDSILEYDIEQTNEINKMVDYVIEQGVNANGYWIKYASGKLVQRGSIPFNVIMNIPWGGTSTLHYADLAGKDFPIPFVGGRPHFMKDIYNTSGVTVTDCMKNGQPTLTNTGGFYIARNGSPSTAGAIGFVDYEAQGFWK